MLAIAIAAGIAVGLLLGALGGGGSILTVPVLVYALGQSAHQATTGSLVVVGVSSLFGLVPHLGAGNVRVGQGLLFGAVGIAGSYLGSTLSRGIDANLLLSLFACLLLVAAASMFRKFLRPESQTQPSQGTMTSTVVRVVLAATAVGFLTGFFGVGGGFAIVPALVLALGFSMPVAVGTSLLVIVVNSIDAFMFHAGGRAPDWGVIAPFAVAAIAGSLVGGHMASRLPKKALGLLFATFLVLVAGYTAARSLPGLF